jgi:hypothetical protein
MANSTKAEPLPQSTPRSLHVGWRCVISVLVLLHLTAVFIPPFTFATRSGPSPDLVSPLAIRVMGYFRIYIDAAFLNHGYAFFAPDPGPSHLIKYRLEFDDGRLPINATFPDLKRHRPRLLYHRHFMLSEQLNGEWAPPVMPPDLPADQVENWKQALESYDAKWNSFEQHLLHKYGAQRITMVRIQHRLPAWLEVRDRNQRLDDPSLFREIPKEVDARDVP